MLRRALTLAVLAALVLAAGSAFAPARPAAAQGGPPPGGPGGPAPGAPGGPRPGMGPGGPRAMMPPDSFAAERDSLIKLVRQDIAGRENAPAESVFKHIKMMKGRTAEQLLRSMNGMGRSLGARCRLCHTENHWADEDKPEKETARLMLAMTDTLNTLFLSRVKTKDGDQVHAGCFTCHRGHPKP